MKHASKRQRGPLPSHDVPAGGDTRTRIIAAARALFAEHGLNGTSVRTITFRAEANLSAVRYYFETKEQLYHHVLMHVVGPIRPRIQWCLHGDAPPLVKIDRAVRAVFDHLRANPDMPAFMVREMASGKPSGVVRGVMGEVLPAMAALIAQGQKDGTIRRGDPALMVLSIFAQPVYLYLTRSATKLDVTEDHVLEHAAAFVRAGLESR